MVAIRRRRTGRAGEAGRRASGRRGGITGILPPGDSVNIPAQGNADAGNIEAAASRGLHVDVHLPLAHRSRLVGTGLLAVLTVPFGSDCARPADHHRRPACLPLKFAASTAIYALRWRGSSPSCRTGRACDASSVGTAAAFVLEVAMIGGRRIAHHQHFNVARRSTP
jgi:hypothetical protein